MKTKVLNLSGKLLAILLTLVMLLGMLPMAALADGTKPDVSICLDKNTVNSGEDLTVTVSVTRDASGTAAKWQWDLIWDSTYFDAKSYTIGTAAQTVNSEETVTPVVTLESDTSYAAPYKASSISSGSTDIEHNLKGGTLATITLTAKQDVPKNVTAKFYLAGHGVYGTDGLAVDIIDTSTTLDWGTDAQTLPTSTGESIKLNLSSVNVTVYYANDDGNIEVGVDGTVLNYVPLTVGDEDGDGIITMADAFTVLHAEYYETGESGFAYQNDGFITRFWGVNSTYFNYLLNYTYSILSLIHI